MPKEYLKMADVFHNEMHVVGDSNNMIADDVGIIIGCYSGDMMAEYVLHAVDSHDELVAEVERLREFERDAMRYRFLRDNCTAQQTDSCGPIFVMTIRRKNNLFNVGLAIDEAMDERKTNGRVKAYSIHYTISITPTPTTTTTA